MRRGRRGFTLIEISLFLAVSALLFLGVTIGVQNSIRQQRFNDSVQSFAEFLRTAYSEVLNVQNVGDGKGRSEQAIYGKLIVFGEKYDLSGAPNNDNAIFMYSIIGDASGAGATGNALTQLNSLNANIFKINEEGNALNLSGAATSYTTRWMAQIEPGCGSTCDYSAFDGMVLIVRHPGSGIVNTYYSDKVFEVNEAIKNASLGQVAEFKNLLGGPKNTFSSQQIDFCVNPDPGSDSVLRRDVRIVKDARNVSGVEIIADDSGDNKCR